MSALPKSADANQRDSVPLCVDLDGTLVSTDVFFESILHLVVRAPWLLFAMPFWLLRGRAYVKRKVAERVSIHPASLPYRSDLLDFLRAEQKSGRQVVLVTAADILPARVIATHLGIFDGVIASDGRINMSGRRKRDVLVTRYGAKNFDYVGNEAADMHVWQASRTAILVNVSARLSARAHKLCTVGRVFSTPEAGSIQSLLRLARPHQWVKNVLLFVPPIAAHQIGEPSVIVPLASGFISLCCCASAIYILNDMLDVGADRVHEAKRHRPVASGQVSMKQAALAASILLVIGAALAFAISVAFGCAIASYVVLAQVYSTWLKRIPVLDVMILASLYTVRVVAGALAVDVVASSWLLGFTTFIFFSIATMKRCAELQGMKDAGDAFAPGRPYRQGDLNFLSVVGIGSAIASVVIFALYLSSSTVEALYVRPGVLWLLCPLLLYWVTRVWLLTSRGEMHEDPALFALKDRTTWLVGSVGLMVLYVAAY